METQPTISENKIIYLINSEDVQNVAQKVFGRVLDSSELEIVENKLGDYIPWYEFVEQTISDRLNLPKDDDKFDDE